MSVDVSVTLDGKPLSSGDRVARRIRRQGIYNASQLVSVFYKQADKLNAAAIQKTWSLRESDPAFRSSPGP